MMEKYGVEHNMQNKEIALKAAKAQNNHYIKYHWLTGEELVCVAGYEAAWVDHYNKHQIDFKWQPEVFILSDGSTYRPDAYLPDRDLWVEIKGYFRKDALEKWTEFHEKIKPNSELLTKKELKEQGIIKG